MQVAETFAFEPTERSAADGEVDTRKHDGHQHADGHQHKRRKLTDKDWKGANAKRLQDIAPLDTCVTVVDASSFYANLKSLESISEVVLSGAIRSQMSCRSRWDLSLS